jgi:hypothetical protein
MLATLRIGPAIFEIAFSAPPIVNLLESITLGKLICRSDKRVIPIAWVQPDTSNGMLFAI